MSGEVQPFAGFFKKFHDLLTPYRREVFHEVVNRIARLEAIQKRPHQDSRARKHGHPTENVRITNDDTGNHEPNVFATLPQSISPFLVTTQIEVTLHKPRLPNLPFLQELISEYDSNIEFGEPVKRPLKYVDASDVLDVIVKAITEPGEKSEEGETGGSTTPQTNATQPNNNTTNTGLNSNSSTGSSGGLSITP